MPGGRGGFFVAGNGFGVDGKAGLPEGRAGFMRRTGFGDGGNEGFFVMLGLLATGGGGTGFGETTGDDFNAAAADGLSGIGGGGGDVCFGEGGIGFALVGREGLLAIGGTGGGPEVAPAPLDEPTIVLTRRGVLLA